MVDAPSSPTLAAVVDGSERRRAIQGILADKSLTDLERRLRVQRLMDGTSSSNNNDTRNGDGATATINVTMPATEITTSMTSWGGLGLGTTLATSSSSTTTTMASRVLSVGGAADDDAKKSGGDEEGGMGDNSVCPPCVHYVGKCEIFAPCCGRPYGCRLCHDEMSPSCGTMDRFGVSEVRCSICKLRQSSKTNECSRCRVRFAEYHCMTCNIWTSLDKMPFHCDICGLCRVGGRENYRHCVTCCMCMSVGVYDTHVCKCYAFRCRCVSPFSCTHLENDAQACLKSTRTTARSVARTCSRVVNRPKTYRAVTRYTSTAFAT
jgi:hypothetical protein